MLYSLSQPKTFLFLSHQNSNFLKTLLLPLIYSAEQCIAGNCAKVLVTKNIFNLQDFSISEKKLYVCKHRMIHSVHKVHCGVLADGHRK